MLKMVDGTGIIGVDMICPLGGTVSPPQPPNFDKVEMEGVGSLTLPNSLKAPLERLELIGNSVQGENPAPDNPQEIKSAGRKSKNLFDAKKAKSGWITSDGKQTLATLGSIDNVISDYIQVYPGMNYTSSASVYQNFYDSEKNFLNHNPNASTSIVVPDNAKYMIVVVGVNRALAIQTANTLMINIGSSALPYEQYTDKYLLDVKVTGKNLFNVNQFENLENIIGRKDFVLQPSEFKAGATYFCSAKVKGDMDTLNRVRIDLFYEDGSKDGYYGNETSSGITKKSFMVRTTSKLIKIVFILQGDTNTKWTDVMIEYGDKMTSYEPYQEPQTLTLTSDRPLTKWDRLVEQGGQYGWLYKHRIVNDLSALVKDSEPIYGKDGEKYFSASLQGALFNYDYNKIYSVAGLCPKDSKIHYVPKPMIQSVVIYVSDTDTIMTAKEHMHYKVIYETTESQFAPLSESEQTQLRNLHSYNGTTNITVDSGEVPCGIKLTYRKEI